MAHVCAHACLVCTYCPRQLLCRSSCSNALGPTFAAATTAPCVRALRNRTRAPKACQESGGHSWPSAQCRSRDREPLTLRRAFVFVSSSSVKARWASSCCVKVLELRGSSGSWRISHDVGRHLHEQSSGGRTWFLRVGSFSASAKALQRDPQLLDSRVYIFEVERRNGPFGMFLRCEN